jgi:hypothetical protein
VPAADDGQSVEEPQRLGEAPTTIALCKSGFPDHARFESETAAVETERAVSVVRECLDNGLQRLLIILCQPMDCEDLKTRAQGPALGGGVAEANNLRTFAVFPCALEELFLGRAAADGAGNAQVGHHRHGAGHPGHRARVVDDLDQYGRVSLAQRLECMDPRVRTNFRAVFHLGSVATFKRSTYERFNVGITRPPRGDSLPSWIFSTCGRCGGT